MDTNTAAAARTNLRAQGNRAIIAARAAADARFHCTECRGEYVDNHGELARVCTPECQGPA